MDSEGRRSHPYWAQVAEISVDTEQGKPRVTVVYPATDHDPAVTCRVYPTELSIAYEE